MRSSVSIATKPLVYSTFRYMGHKVYNALAEYVDNSIQSYVDHKDILQPINKDHKLNVYITIDIENDRIQIKDDAFGIAEGNYQRAFELANIPLDASGLNEFGMGMKVSSIWLSNLWTVETSAYGENVCKTVSFDLEEVVKKEMLELDVHTTPANVKEHYTTITLTQLSQNKPSGRQIPYLKKHMASIYTRYIREGVLNLYVNDELLKVEEQKILNAPYYKTPNEPPVLWKKEINFSVPKFQNGVICGEYRVSGFIGVLEKMSTSTDNGILLFRRGRVIGSSYDDRYRPKALSGEEGSPRYKRIFGEFDVEGFNVSFTKSSFTEDDEFTSFIELLREDIGNDKKFDLFGQAQFYKKPTNMVTKEVAIDLTDKLVKEFTKPIITKTPKVTAVPAATAPHIEEPVIEPSVAIANPINTEVDMDGFKFDLELGHVKGNVSDWLYNLEVKGNNQYKTNFNLTNPFFSRFDKVFTAKDGEGYLPVAMFIKYMVATEIKMMKEGHKDASNFRIIFNKLFGQEK